MYQSIYLYHTLFLYLLPDTIDENGFIFVKSRLGDSPSISPTMTTIFIKSHVTRLTCSFKFFKVVPQTNQIIYFHLYNYFSWALVLISYFYTIGYRSMYPPKYFPLQSFLLFFVDLRITDIELQVLLYNIELN